MRRRWRSFWSFSTSRPSSPGFAADICVLDTANDAYMREYQLIVPSDCVASESAEITRATLDHLRDRLKARVEASEDLLAVR